MDLADGFKLLDALGGEGRIPLAADDVFADGVILPHIHLAMFGECLVDGDVGDAVDGDGLDDDAGVGLGGLRCAGGEGRNR